MHRIFIGLRPSPAMRAAAIAIMGGIPGARWQSDEQLHVTLKFIGDVDRHQLGDIAAALAGVVAPAPSARLSGVGVFAKSGRVHTLYAGLAPHDDLLSLDKKVDQTCASAGVPREQRRFHPHITLARMNRSSGTADGFLAVHAGLSGPAETFPHLILYESTLGSEGASYTMLERFALA